MRLPRLEDGCVGGGREHERGDHSREERARGEEHGGGVRRGGGAKSGVERELRMSVGEVSLASKRDELTQRRGVVERSVVVLAVSSNRQVNKPDRDASRHPDGLCRALGEQGHVCEPISWKPMLKGKRRRLQGLSDVS